MLCFLAASVLACSPEIRDDGVLRDVFKALPRGSHLSCRTAANLPAECMLPVGDTMAFIYTDAHGTPIEIGKELTVGSRTSERTFDNVRRQLSASYGQAITCPAAGADFPHMLWVGRGFAVTLQGWAASTTDSGLVRWGWAANRTSCFTLSARPGFM